MSVVQDATSERRALREAVRSYLSRASRDVEASQPISPDGRHALWKGLVDELQIVGIGIPDTYGGAGYALTEQMIMLEEIGRVLASVPYLAGNVLPSRLLLETADRPVEADLLSRLASGSVVAMGIAETNGDWWATEYDCRATQLAHEAWELTGEKSFVLAADDSDVLLIAAATVHGPSVFAVSSQAAGVEIVKVRSFDPQASISTVKLNGARGDLVGEAGGALGPLADCVVAGAVGIAAEDLGAAEGLFDITISHVRNRQQFGRAIGSFQAVKHKCAEMAICIESSRALVIAAVADIELGKMDSTMPGLAKVATSNGLCFVAEESIQLLGALGYSDEHPAHLYLKRARGSRPLFGHPEAYLERLRGHLQL
jgi:alkylation response protein AidB-like acyl-CoA dehydrogenase